MKNFLAVRLALLSKSGMEQTPDWLLFLSSGLFALQRILMGVESCRDSEIPIQSIILRVQ